MVLGLKLLWRLFSCQSSLWVKWIHCYLIRKGSFWSMRSNNTGSWMWKKILKLRDLAKPYLKMEVHNGEHTSFWYDSWSRLGCLKDLLGDGGTLTLGIPDNSLVADVMFRHRRRRHRLSILNDVEEEIARMQSSRSEEEDLPLWRQNENNFANSFSTKKTWQSIRQTGPDCNWKNGIWFPQSTPKFSFIVWVAIRNRLQTCDRMKIWNNTVDGTCVLCREEEETCRHLFFGCRYAGRVWKELVGSIMGSEFTSDWDEIIEVISRQSQANTESYLVRYAFQALVHSVWRERNARRHGEQPKDEEVLYKFVDKIIRLKLLAVKGQGKRYLEEGLSKWFGTRRQLHIL